LARNQKVIRPAKIFSEAHNFVPWCDFDERIFFAVEIAQRARATLAHTYEVVF
jgi:hypothetical protein